MAGSAEALERFERQTAWPMLNAPEGNIESIPDGLWWAATTVTTVGYGDTFPTTAAGRAVAVMLMLIGVGLFGLLAASLASFLIERDEGTAEDPAHNEIIERLERIERRLDERYFARGHAPVDAR